MFSCPARTAVVASQAKHAWILLAFLLAWAAEQVLWVSTGGREACYEVFDAKGAGSVVPAVVAALVVVALLFGEGGALSTWMLSGLILLLSLSPSLGSMVLVLLTTAAVVRFEHAVESLTSRRSIMIGVGHMLSRAEIPMNSSRPKNTPQESWRIPDAKSFNRVWGMYFSCVLTFRQHMVAGMRVARWWLKCFPRVRSWRLVYVPSLRQLEVPRGCSMVFPFPGQCRNP